MFEIYKYVPLFVVVGNESDQCQNSSAPPEEACFMAPNSTVANNKYNLPAGKSRINR